MDSQNKISGSSPIPDDSIQVSNTNPSSKWKGRAVVQWNNSKINDVKYFGINRGSKTGKFFGKILDRIFRKTHYALDMSDGKRIYIRKKDLTHRLDLAQKVDSAIPLLKEITHKDLSIPTEVEVIHAACHQLLEMAAARNKDIQKFETIFADTRITLIALKNEEGKYDLYAKESSKSRTFNTSILGQGAFKKVIKIVDISNSRLMAMAKPRKDKYFTSSRLKRGMKQASVDIKLEYTITKKLKNDGVPYINVPRALKVYKGKKSYDKYIFVSNLASQGSLEQYAGKYQEDPLKFKKWGLQICQAINGMHTKGNLLHLDIKPANILIGSNNEVLITDFGLSDSIKGKDRVIAKLTSLFKRETGYKGTPLYLAPEIFEGKGKTDWNPNPQYDAWAVGMTLLALKHGEEAIKNIPIPYYHKDATKSKKDIQTDIKEGMKAYFDKELNKQDPYDQVILGLLEVDPSKRMTLDRAIELLGKNDTTN